MGDHVTPPFTFKVKIPFFSLPRKQGPAYEAHGFPRWQKKATLGSWGA